MGEAKTVKTGDVILVNGKFAGYHGKTSGSREHKVESHASAMRKAKRAHGPNNHIEFMDFDEYQKKHKTVKEEALNESSDHDQAFDDWKRKLPADTSHIDSTKEKDHSIAYKKANTPDGKKDYEIGRFQHSTMKGTIKGETS